MAETGWKSETRFPDFSRDKFIPAIDANAIRRLIGWEEIKTADGHAWARVDKSEQFNIELSPNTETKGYIDTANDTERMVSYQVSQEQEIIIDGNNEVYALMYEYTMHFPVGSDAIVPNILLAPSVVDPDVVDAFMWEDAILTPVSLNTIDKKLTFNIAYNGTMKRGTGAKDADTGRFLFQAKDSAKPPATEDDSEEVQTLSAKTLKAAK